MRRSPLPALALLFPAVLAAQDPTDWAGTWWTSRGVVVMEAAGDSVEGRLRDEDGSTIDGELEGRRLRVKWRSGNAGGEATWTLDRDGAWFEGPYRTSQGGSGTWRGWREDPDATKGRRAKWDGAWRTSWGIVVLEQDGDEVEGELGAQGWYRVSGTADGRRLELDYTSPFGPGEVWLEQRDGDAAYGAAVLPSTTRPFVAQRLEGFEAAPKPKPGAIVSGLSENRMTYHVRVPTGWRKGKDTPLVVFLHGSNMSARPYVETLGKELGDRFAVAGIDGERWVDSSEPDDPRHNYTYVNWMGRSTYRGYPNTDRESPALVAEVIRELREMLEPSKVFVGGHSQGGFLSYFLLMHEPELVDGVFPVAAGLVIQCEPDVFDDEELRKAQRATPLAVVHGRNDGAVAFSQGLSSFRSFEEHGFPMLRLFDNDAPHAFVALRWVEAVEWLDALTSDDVDTLLEFAQRRLDEDGFRDATAAVLRARELGLSGARKERADAIARTVDEYAEGDAERLREAITANEDGTWVDGFLEFRARFEFADAARPVMAAYAKLREEHEPKAKELYGEARQAFRNGDRDGGWRKYEELVETCYASSLYRRVKGWLDDR